MRKRQWDKPSVIFLDAVGTLFGVKGGVGAVYAAIARNFGVEVSPGVLDRAFLQSFRKAAAPAQKLSDVHVQEFNWWQGVVRQTFEQAGVLPQFSDFTAFFIALYNHFATADPWFIYPDVVPALTHWQQQDIQLGILSNFDSRLYSVLTALDLAEFFSSITLSTQVGVAKPNPEIFSIALQRHQCLPERAWHIGDRYDEDYQAACAVGMRGIWLKRRNEG